MLVSCLIIYLINYTIGWLLYLKIITMSKRTHQIFFAAIIINLLVILFFQKLSLTGIIFCASSLATMLILPLGKKGGVYHRVVSTAGLLLFIAVLTVENL